MQTLRNKLKPSLTITNHNTTDKVYNLQHIDKHRVNSG